MTLMSTDPSLSPCQVTVRYMAAMILTSRDLLLSVKNHNLKGPNWTFIAFQGFVKKCSYAMQIQASDLCKDCHKACLLHPVVSFQNYHIVVHVL